MQYEEFNALLNSKMRHENFVAQDSVLKFNSRLSFYCRYPVAKMA